ncbi:MAG: hypothetical protein AAF564_18795 [Bacteroidota bacterium]
MKVSRFTTIVLCAGMIFCLNACSVFEKEEPEAPRDYLEEIQMHAQAFRFEAAMRSVDIEGIMSLVQFEIADEVVFEGQSLCGFAPWYDDPETGQPTITIVTSKTCWIDRPVEDNEALVFHELGHIVLDRGHREGLLPNNSRPSIMIGTNLAGLYVGNAKERRKYYVDELFNPDTPVPEWAE